MTTYKIKIHEESQKSSNTICLNNLTFEELKKLVTEGGHDKDTYTEYTVSVFEGNVHPSEPVQIYNTQHHDHLKAYIAGIEQNDGRCTNCGDARQSTLLGLYGLAGDSEIKTKAPDTYIKGLPEYKTIQELKAEEYCSECTSCGTSEECAAVKAAVVADTHPITGELSPEKIKHYKQLVDEAKSHAIAATANFLQVDQASFQPYQKAGTVLVDIDGGVYVNNQKVDNVRNIDVKIDANGKTHIHLHLSK